MISPLENTMTYDYDSTYLQGCGRHTEVAPVGSRSLWFSHSWRNYVDVCLLFHATKKYSDVKQQV